MNQIVVSQEQARQIAAANGPVSVVDATGAVIAVCTPVGPPLSREYREELERRQKEAREHPELGKTTAEVLEHLRKLGEEPA
jgi:hypothetical protein